MFPYPDQALECLAKRCALGRIGLLAEFGQLEIGRQRARGQWRWSVDLVIERHFIDSFTFLVFPVRGV